MALQAPCILLPVCPDYQGGRTDQGAQRYLG